VTGMEAQRKPDPYKALQYARAAHLRELFEPWTYRKLEMRTRIGRSTLQSRMTGDTALTIQEIETLAPVIRMKAEELFSELMGVKLPDLDSNQEPAGYTLHHVDANTTATIEHTANVLHFRPRAS